jgi:betaine-aldehyde dehydrogenase
MAVSQTSCEPMFINGEWTEGSSGKRIPVYDPSTEEVIAEIPDASAADVDAAVAAARHAFDEGGWPQTTAQDRGRILFRIAAKLREEAPQLAELESKNCGKPIVESEYDIADAATCFEYYGGLATKVSGSVNPVPDNALSLTVKEPVGVAGQIIPWNYPIGMAAWKLAPALAAGCTCVLKPAEQTPLTMLKLAGWLAECGVPAGVVNVVTGLGTAGAAIVAHPAVDKIAFTGSASTPSSASLWSWAASHPTSFLKMPASRQPLMARYLESLSTRARSARPAAGCWCSDLSMRNSLKR